MNRLAGFVVVVVGLLGATYFANVVLLQQPFDEVISADARNSGISANVHFGYYLNPSEVVFDLGGVSGANSPADVSRVLLQFASRLKDEEFSRVILSYRGKRRFQLEGAYFRTLGEEYGIQNPVYTMRHFPQNVYDMDGKRAFGTWRGGLLGVVNRQMEDFNAFHRRWYLSDLARRR